MPDLYIGNNLAKCLCQAKTGAQDRRYTDTARQALSNHRAHRSLDGKGLQGQGCRSLVSQQSPNFLYKAIKLWWLRVFIAQRCHLVSHSLKDKRQIIKSLVARVRNRFEVAIAEVEEQDRWQIAILGISCVTNSSQHAGEVLGHVQRYIEETRPDIILSNVETEIITW